MAGYCWICRCPSDVGFHGPDGKLVLSSVPVAEDEIEAAQLKSGASRWSRERTRSNIALGKHIGVYRPDGWWEDDRHAGPTPLPDEGYVRLAGAVLRLR